MTIRASLVALGAAVAQPAAAAEPAAAGPAKLASPCDRACLTQVAAQTVQGMLANDSSRLPLAKAFRYTENGQDLRPFTALWGTLSAYAGQDPAVAPAAADLDYKVIAADPASGQVVTLIETDENGAQGVLALRLKVAGGELSEAEAVTVREEFGGSRGGTVALFQPRLLNTMDGDKVAAADPLFARAETGAAGAAMKAAASAYLDALVRGSSRRLAIAADCVRRDNGVQTTGVAASPPLDRAVPNFRVWAQSCAGQIDSKFYSFVERVRERRFVADVKHGLVVAFAMIDNPGTALTFDAPGIGKVAYPGPRGAPRAAGTEQFDAELADANMIAPATAESVFVFKFVDGKIARIDNFARNGPYGQRSGWNAETIR